MKRRIVVTMLAVMLIFSAGGIIAEASTGSYGPYYITYTLSGSGSATKKATGTTNGASAAGANNKVFVGLYKNTGALVKSNSSTSANMATATVSKTGGSVYMAKSTHDFVNSSGVILYPSYTKRITWIY